MFRKMPVWFGFLWVSFFGAVDARSASPPDPLLEAARQQEQEFDRQYAQGKQLYAAGRFAEAIECFQKALSRKPDANTVYNIAQAYRKLGNCEKAKGYYEWFLRSPSPDTTEADLDKVRKYVAECAPQTAPSLVVTRQRPAWRIGVGIAGMAVGAGLIVIGGLAASINGRPGLVDGKEDLSRFYNTGDLAVGLIVPGSLLALGGVVLVALPGEKKVESLTQQKSATRASMGRVGSGMGLTLDMPF
jgi:tetratricopeptide (TPR) repeat protein